MAQRTHQRGKESVSERFKEEDGFEDGIDASVFGIVASVGRSFARHCFWMSAAVFSWGGSSVAAMDYPAGHPKRRCAVPVGWLSASRAIPKEECGSTQSRAALIPLSIRWGLPWKFMEAEQPLVFDSSTHVQVNPRRICTVGHGASRSSGRAQVSPARICAEVHVRSTVTSSTQLNPRPSESPTRIYTEVRGS